jgi:MFS family permease
MFNERVPDVDRRYDPHLSVEQLPRNASRVTVACILAQLGTGYAFQSLCVVPKEMVTLPDARPSDKRGRYFRWLALLNVYGIGVFTGALFLMFLSNRFGRKIIMVTGLLLALVGGVVQASSLGCIQVR